MRNIPLKWRNQSYFSRERRLKVIPLSREESEPSKPFLLGWRDQSCQSHSSQNEGIKTIPTGMEESEALAGFPSPTPAAPGPHVLTLAHHKDLGRLIAGGLGLGGLDLLEELLEDPQEGLVIPGTENLCDEPATLAQELTGQLQGHEGQVGCSRRKEGVRQ